jgi:hypothetical protein
VAGQTVPKEVLEAETLSRQYAAPHVNFYDPTLYTDMAAGDATTTGSTEQQQEAVAQAVRIDAFFTALALCHTVIPEKVAGGEVVLSASSPDDEALVLGAKVSCYYQYQYCQCCIANTAATAVAGAAAAKHVSTLPLLALPTLVLLQIPLLLIVSTLPHVNALLLRPATALLCYVLVTLLQPIMCMLLTLARVPAIHSKH